MIQTILHWLFGNPHFTGLLPDTRPQYEKNKDYLHEERNIQAPADPFSNQQILKSPYPYENQNQTDSCVPHGAGLALAIERQMDAGTYQRLAWIFNYRLRSNYPAAGSYLQGQMDFYRKFGAPLFTTLPTPFSEAEANALILTQQEYTEAAIFKGLEYWTISNCSDIQTLASVAQQGHGVPILIYATIGEWAQDYPTVMNANLNSSTAEVRHCVCILPNSGFTLNGKRYVTVQDSAWFGGKQLRHLSEDWVKARVYGAAYWDKVAVAGAGAPPTYTFTKPLQIGASGEEVRQMQLLLISQGLLPNDCATGYFGGKTLAAVKAFQARYAQNILIPSGLTTPTGFWGNASIKQANLICGH